MAVDVIPPNHCTAETVWLCDNGAVGHVDPFIVDPDAVTPALDSQSTSEPMNPSKIDTAFYELSLQTFKP